MIVIWNTKIPRADEVLTKNDGVCELHFNSEDVIKNKTFEDKEGNKIHYYLMKPYL